MVALEDAEPLLFKIMCGISSISKAMMEKQLNKLSCHEQP